MKSRSSKPRSVKDPGQKIIGFGWTGIWKTTSAHRLGFLMPPHLSHNGQEPLTELQQDSLNAQPKRCATSDMYRVRITVEPMKDKRGRYIVRRTKGPK